MNKELIKEFKAHKITSPIGLMIDTCVYNRHGEITYLRRGDLSSFMQPQMGGDYGLYSIPITKDGLVSIGLVSDAQEILYQPSQQIQEKCKGDEGWHCPSFFFNSRLNRWVDCQTRVCVDYLHQVQNLVFVLTGEMLELQK